MGVSRLVLLCLSVATAHNWLTSPARGNQGRNYNGWTSPPCPQKADRVHVQVAAGQRFPIEWASGHGYGSYTFFVVLDAKFEGNMIAHTLESLDEYLKEAPASALTYMSDTWAMHSAFPGGHAPGTYLDKNAVITDPAFTANPRHEAWKPASPAGTTMVWNKTKDAVKNDKRAMYTNPKMPWIISVHKFALHDDLAEEMDLAYLEIPKGYPSGQYIVQYLWNGYYDCVDVNVLPTTSTDLFGSEATETKMDRIDHCLFNMSLKVLAPDPPNPPKEVDSGFAVREGCIELRPGDSVQPCLDLCLSLSDPYSGNGCNGVQVSPVSKPASAKFVGMHQTGTSHLPVLPSCNVASMANTSSVCYPVWVGKSPIVGPPFKIVADPEDPVFYSTCYRKPLPWKFVETCAACSTPVLKPTNKFGYSQNSCISCRDMYLNQPASATPIWNVDSACFACDSTLG